MNGSLRDDCPQDHLSIVERIVLEMTKKELKELTITLLMHKYRYYVTFQTTISDYEYDMLESKLLKEVPDMDNWVGFDEKHPLAKEALKRLKKSNELDPFA